MYGSVASSGVPARVRAASVSVEYGLLALVEEVEVHIHLLHRGERVGM